MTKEAMARALLTTLSWRRVAAKATAIWAKPQKMVRRRESSQEVVFGGVGEEGAVEVVDRGGGGGVQRAGEGAHGGGEDGGDDQAEQAGGEVADDEVGEFLVGGESAATGQDGRMSLVEGPEGHADQVRKRANWRKTTKPEVMRAARAWPCERAER